MDSIDYQKAALGGRMLEAVGLSDEEERAYEVLLERPGSPLTELSEILSTPRRRTGRVLASLEEKGMVTRSPERIPRYAAAPPDVAVDALILKRQEELQRARLAITGLMDRARRGVRSRPPTEELVEILTGRDAVAQRFSQLQRAAEREVLVFDRPPYLNPNLQDTEELQQNMEELEALARGVRYRAVYDREALEVRGQPAALEEIAEAGEEARVFSPVPVKLAIVDGRAGLLPLSLEQPKQSGALLVRPSSLLDALMMFFEIVWDRAIPIGFTESGATEFNDALPGPSSDFYRLIPLLASGLQDQVVARQLGFSPRTLDRRIRQLMKDLHASTRFQAGWIAALRQQEFDRTSEQP